MSVVCYPQPGKEKSRVILDAFAAGCGGCLGAAPLDRARAAAFFGVVGIETLFEEARKGDWFYGDNSFFDSGRGKFFRFARGAFQISTLQRPDHGRRRRLGIEVRPWRKTGEHVLVVEQSEHFLGLVGQKPATWLGAIVAMIESRTDRPIRVRRWTRDKAKAASTLGEDLKSAWALVTHASAAANEALIAGVPVFVAGQCAAVPMASGSLWNIDEPALPDGREDWAAGLAASMWTLEELRNGTAWRTLNA